LAAMIYPAFHLHPFLPVSRKARPSRSAN